MTTEATKLTLPESMKNLGLEMRLSTEDVVAMVVTKRQQQFQAEKDVLCQKHEEINKIINDSAFREEVKAVIDKFIKDNNLPKHTMSSTHSDYKDDKAILTLSLTFELPTDSLDNMLKIRKEKGPELGDLNNKIKVVNEKMNNVKAMERETRAQLAELKLRAMGQDVLIESLVTPTQSALA